MGPINVWITLLSKRGMNLFFLIIFSSQIDASCRCSHVLPTECSIHSALASRLLRSSGQLGNSLPGGESSYNHLWKAVTAVRERGFWLAVSEQWGLRTKRQQIWCRCELRSDQPLPDWPPPHSTWGRSGWSVRGTQTQISTAEALRGWGLGVVDIHPSEENVLTQRSSILTPTLFWNRRAPSELVRN